MATADPVLVTGASGQLGRLVIDELLRRLPASRIVAAVRNPAAARDLAERGVELRKADYEEPASLDAALAGIGRVLLISSNAVGQRVPQHRNVVDAARRGDVGLLAYTSILRADTNPMQLASEHRQTEALIRASGLAHIFLRNGWYTENYTRSIGAAVEHGVVLGGAGDGLISAAARADYAAAAAAALLADLDGPETIHELAGDSAFTMAQYATEVARQSGKPVVYRDLPEAEFKAALQGFGLPEGFAAILADCDVQAAKGALFDEGRALGKLIGRPTTPLAQSIAAALA